MGQLLTVNNTVLVDGFEFMVGFEAEPPSEQVLKNLTSVLNEVPDEYLPILSEGIPTGQGSYFFPPVSFVFGDVQKRWEELNPKRKHKQVSGFFYPRTSEIHVSLHARASTLEHEINHAIDRAKAVQDGFPNGIQFASQDPNHPIHSHPEYLKCFDDKLKLTILDEKICKNPQEAVAELNFYTGEIETGEREYDEDWYEEFGRFGGPYSD